MQIQFDRFNDAIEMQERVPGEATGCLGDSPLATGIFF